MENEKTPYTIVSEDGCKSITSEGGKVLFNVTDDFTDAQIEVVYNLCNGFFKNGFSVGSLSNQAKVCESLGITQLISQLLSDTQTSEK